MPKSAVIVGISKFADSSLGNVPSCRRDAIALYLLLTHPELSDFHPKNVVLVVDPDNDLDYDISLARDALGELFGDRGLFMTSEIDRNDISWSLSKLSVHINRIGRRFAKDADTDPFYFFFTGHAQVIGNLYGILPDTSVLDLVTSDSDLRDQYALDITELIRAIQKARSPATVRTATPHSYFVLHCCYAASACNDDGTPAGENYEALVTPQQLLNTTFICSSEHNRVTYVRDSDAISPFFRDFFHALSANPQSSVASFSDTINRYRIQREDIEKKNIAQSLGKAVWDLQLPDRSIIIRSTEATSPPFLPISSDRLAGAFVENPGKIEFLIDLPRALGNTQSTLNISEPSGYNSAINELAKHKVITIVIGAESQAIGRESLIKHLPIAHNVANLRSLFQDSPASLAFLDTFANSYHIPAAQSSADTPQDPLLFAFQRSLIELSVTVWQLVVRSDGPVAQALLGRPWYKCKIDPEYLSVLETHILRSKDILREYLSQHRDFDGFLIGANLIEEGLDKLTKIEETERPWDRPRWLTDLLWFTLRFQSPLYPTRSELAFQLRPWPPLALFHSVVDVSGKRLTGRLRDWFEYYSVRSLDSFGHDPVSDFHDALASFLRAKDRQGTPPVIMTTNFDREIEKALARQIGADGSYSVILPVIFDPVPEANYDPDKKLAWLLGVFSGSRNPQWSVIEPGNPRWDKLVKGPTVIRLNGSPGQRLPGRFSLRDTVENREYSLRPAIVVEEKDYVHEMLLYAQRPLRFVRSSLMRDVLFVGLSFDEWVHRARFYYASTYSSQGDNPADPVVFRVAVNESWDEDRTKILKAAGVKSWNGHLALMADMLRGAIS